jgi:hypothetical protein
LGSFAFRNVVKVVPWHSLTNTPIVAGNQITDIQDAVKPVGANAEAGQERTGKDVMLVAAVSPA